jgi:uncharacterized membrane protein YfcA
MGFFPVSPEPLLDGWPRVAVGCLGCALGAVAAWLLMSSVLTPELRVVLGAMLGLLGIYLLVCGVGRRWPIRAPRVEFNG